MRTQSISNNQPVYNLPSFFYKEKYKPYLIYVISSEDPIAASSLAGGLLGSSILEYRLNEEFVDPLVTRN